MENIEVEMFEGVVCVRTGLSQNCVRVCVCVVMHGGTNICRNGYGFCENESSLRLCACLCGCMCVVTHDGDQYVFQIKLILSECKM